MSDDYKHGIEYTITVTDKDKVISNGEYEIELQNSSNKNACSEGNEDDCRVIVDFKGKGTCEFKNGNKCDVVSQDADKMVVKVTFDNLEADTRYVIFVNANTYRNNYNLEEKNGSVYVRKAQFTKSDLGFSLGSVTPTATKNTEVTLTFVGAAELNKYLKGIEYSIAVQGGDTIASGTIGKTFDKPNEKDITFSLDNDDYPYIKIPITDGNMLGANNVINITYYYANKDNELVVLNLNGKTVNDYDFKLESK